MWAGDSELTRDENETASIPQREGCNDCEGISAIPETGGKITDGEGDDRHNRGEYQGGGRRQKTMEVGAVQGDCRG